MIMSTNHPEFEPIAAGIDQLADLEICDRPASAGNSRERLLLEEITTRWM